MSEPIMPHNLRIPVGHLWRSYGAVFLRKTFLQTWRCYVELPTTAVKGVSPEYDTLFCTMAGRIWRFSLLSSLRPFAPSVLTISVI
jgi:hypothetical protein